MLPGILAIGLGVSGLLSACSSEGEQSGKEAQASPSAAAIDPKALATKKFDPPVTISTAIIQEQRDNTFKPGETIENNAFSKWLKDNMGIEVKLDFIVGKQADFDTKIRLLLASNDKLPDVFNGSATSDLIDAGKLMPLNDAIEKYASPNLKKLYAQFPQAFESVTRDGKIYGIPHFKTVDEGGVMWLREDWLKKLNLKAPTTISELGQVLDAFTNRDPDGNSKNDTFGLAVSLKEGMYTWMASADPLFGAFSDYMAPARFVSQSWNVDKSGKLVYSAIDPSAKPFLETMADWKKKGFIDREAAVKDPTKAVEPAVKGIAGVIFGPNWMGQYPLEDTVKTVPGAVWKAYPIPAGPDGKIGRVASLTSGTVVFNKDFKHIDAWFAYINKLYARQFGESDPFWVPEFKEGFLEGYDFVRHEGKIVKNGFKDKGVPTSQWPLANGKEMDMRYMVSILNGAYSVSVPYLGDPGYKKFSENPNAEAANAAEERVKAMTKEQLAAGVVRQTQTKADKFNVFQGANSEAMQSKGALLNKLESEAYLKIIYGEKPLEYFDEFVKEWKTNGGDQVTEDVNKWYQSLKSK
ncbi:MAG: hypothetical protein K0Q90_983 [Paenibacillaceae bacterium]|nr:hypothetical protein [Paenibacillaceae bacterium]